MDRKIGQMVICGFRGLEVDDKSPIVHDIRNGILGGVVLFDRDAMLKEERRNIESPGQLRRLISSLQERAPIPLLVAVDQEGGKVRRLKEVRGFPPLPDAEELGRHDDSEATAAYAAKTAEALATAGINVNLAPVVDLNLNPQNPVIGSLGRSFSSDPAVVVRQARAFIQAHRAFGVATALKHFPGHGSSSADSHLELPDLSRSWQEVELEPFHALIAAGAADLVMTAHVFQQGLDREFPATLSRRIIGGILRRRLEFTGPVISDDFNMQAISAHFGLERAVELAIKAGVDLLIFGNNLVYDEEIAGKVVAIIHTLLQKKRISPARIALSFRRIMTLKKRYLDFDHASTPA